jgi:hypothetical protein
MLAAKGTARIAPEAAGPHMAVGGEAVHAPAGYSFSRRIDAAEGGLWKG